MNTTFPPNTSLGRDDSAEALKQTLQALQQAHAELEQKYAELSNRCSMLEQQNAQLHSMSHCSDESTANSEEQIAVLKKASSSIDEGLAHCWAIANHPVFKIANKSIQLLEHSTHTRTHCIMESLNQSNAYLNELLSAYYRSVMPHRLIAAEALSRDTQAHLQAALTKPYQKFDVLIFGTIDYDYLYQRPQHFADYFAKIGHRVFYINASFHCTKDFRIRKEKENLYLIDLPCFSKDDIYSIVPSDVDSETIISLDNLLLLQGITDAVMIADHPNWVHMLMRLKKLHGFRLITDYMDDYTGFENKEQEMVVAACRQLLQSSDLVIASSLYLKQQASKFNPNVALIRNGTEFDHFNKAYRMPSDAPGNTIGYYGVISSWFDYKKIKYLSSRFPQHDIVLIGDVLESKKKYFEPLKNVHLLGVKPYAILPQFLEAFDVCLIPFDASLNLIKATNPVKFYEYLSAGKKVVATEIPELEPFRDQYVYLANNNVRFGDYVEQCLNGTDTLASADECMKFARENDWTERSKQFTDCVKNLSDKITIIVDDRNGGDYNTCANRILAVTAYPNYTVIPIKEASPAILDSCNQIVLLRATATVYRGWLTKLVHTMSLTKADVVCAATERSDSYSANEDLSLALYIRAAKQVLTPDFTAPTVSEECILLRAELAQETDLFSHDSPLAALNQKSPKIAAVHAAIT